MDSLAEVQLTHSSVFDIVLLRTLEHHSTDISFIISRNFLYFLINVSRNCCNAKVQWLKYDCILN